MSSNSPVVAIEAPGKINIQLRVGGCRDDGFHELANAFMSVSFCDVVSISPARSLAVTVSGPMASQVPGDESNLVAQAARLLGRSQGLAPNVHIHIEKHLPVQGGMGGGSADCAATLIGCEALWKTGISNSEMAALAGDLGSDVPFSLLGGTALGLGRGEILTPLSVSGDFSWVLAVAEEGLSTPSVYAELKRSRENTGVGSHVDVVPAPQVSPGLFEALAEGDSRRLGKELSNDMEAVAVAMHPSLAETLDAGLQGGAIASVLCGTGATCAFLTEGDDAARSVASALTASGTCASVHRARGPVSGPRILG